MWKRIWSKRPETPQPLDPTQPPTDEELIERIAREVVDRRLAAPTTFLLESSKPLTFIASQGLFALGPFVDAALDVPSYERFCEMIEKRENVEKLLQRIEALEEERLGRASAKKDQPPPGEETAAHGPCKD